MGSKLSIPTFGEVQPHLLERMNTLQTKSPVFKSLDDDQEKLEFYKFVSEYAIMLGALNDSAQVTGTIQSVFDGYMAQIMSAGDEDAGFVLIRAMKDLRMASDWR